MIFINFLTKIYFQVLSRQNSIDKIGEGIFPEAKIDLKKASKVVVAKRSAATTNIDLFYYFTQFCHTNTDHHLDGQTQTSTVGLFRLH